MVGWGWPGGPRERPATPNRSAPASGSGLSSGAAQRNALQLMPCAWLIAAPPTHPVDVDAPSSSAARTAVAARRRPPGACALAEGTLRLARAHTRFKQFGIAARGAPAAPAAAGRMMMYVNVRGCSRRATRLREGRRPQAGKQDVPVRSTTGLMRKALTAKHGGCRPPLPLLCVWASSNPPPRSPGPEASQPEASQLPCNTVNIEHGEFSCFCVCSLSRSYPSAFMRN